MNRSYDITLDGKGYMLSKGVGGVLQSGSVQSRMSDPFSRFVSEEGKNAIQELFFDAGAGAERYDGTHRYAYGTNIDSRSSSLQVAPGWKVYGANVDGHAGVAGTVTPQQLEIPAAGRYGGLCNFGSSRTIRRCGVLLARKAGVDYAGAGDVTIQLCTADGNNPPGTEHTSATISMEEDELWRQDNAWVRDELVWFEVVLADDVTQQHVWIVVNNTSSEPVMWGMTGAATCGISTYSGSWSSVIPGISPQFRLKEKADIDGFIRDLVTYRPTDGERNIYAAVSNKLMQYDPETDDWTNIKDDCAGPILDLCVFNNLLHLAMGNTEYIRYWTGAAWTQDAAEKAQCFAVHDNLLWKADGAILKASKESGVGGWEDYAVGEPTQGAIGDPGTPILAMVSHGGKLFCAKPEGVFEVTYPETFPASEVPPVGNTALDFSTERSHRGFAVDWLSGLYFPGEHGLFEWKNSILRDTWIERRDTADEVLPGAVYEPYVGAFTAAVSTTRGLILAQSGLGVSRDGHATQIWTYDTHGFHPMMIELEAQGDPCFAMLLESEGEGIGHLWWGVGFEIFLADWPTWTVDTSRVTPGIGVCYNNTAMVLLSTLSEPDAYVLKHWSKVNVHIEQLDTEMSGLSLRAQMDGVWVDLTRSSDSWAGPTVEFAFPDGTTGYSCQLELTIIPPYEEGQYGPRIERLDIFYQPLPEVIQQHELLLAVKSFTLLHAGGQDSRTAGEVIADLQELADTEAPFVYVDPWGIRYSVRVMGMIAQLARQREKVPGVHGFDLEAQVRMTLLEVE